MQIDVEQLLDRSGMGPVHRRALVLCALVALVDGYDLQSMASAIPTLAGDWGMAPGDLRWIGTAALVGIAGAALFVSPLGDHLGRRTLLLASFALIGIATVMTATATDVNALFAWRFITGIGLGASMPNALALAAEYVPLNRRIALITLLSAGFSLGGASSGFLAPALIAIGGWRAIFAVGGAVMLLLWLPLLALPESVRFMVVRGRAPHAIGTLLERLAPAYRFSAEHRFVQPAALASRVSVRELFRDGLAPTTVTLWAIFFLNLGLLFLLATWLPVLLRAHGLPLDSALRYAALFQIGGVAGGILLSWLVRGWGPFVVLGASYAIAAGALLLLATRVTSPVSLALMLLLIGNGVVGVQAVLNALAASLYPTRARATGVGWAHGIGRGGAILAPVIGGAFLGANASPPRVFVLAIALTVSCACGIAAMRWAVKQSRGQHGLIRRSVDVGNQ